MKDTILSPSDFVDLLNQTLEFAYPSVLIEGELSNFRVTKNRWVYFSLKDESSSVDFFGTVYMLPGPLEDGLVVRVVGSPRLHARFGFSVNITSIVPVGEGSLKKVANLLAAKLEAEGLFDQERKRQLPTIPRRIGLITASNSAAYTDFIKIINARWGGLQISHIDVYVQGEQAPGQIIAAIDQFNQMSEFVDAIIITRGGGSPDDLATFSDERVVRKVAASRIPTLVAVGHERDVSLAELAADKRASTPSNAAELLVPDRHHEIVLLENSKNRLSQLTDLILASERDNLHSHHELFNAWFSNYFQSQQASLDGLRRLVEIFSPSAALKRGYALVLRTGVHINSVVGLQKGDIIDIRMRDGETTTTVEQVRLNGQV